MKKILGMIVACAAATVGLLSCSGGSDNNVRGVMTMQQFYSGSRQFTFNGATQLKLYAIGPVAGGSHTEDRSDAEGIFAHAAGSYSANLVYTITAKADDGTPSTATLDVTFTSETLASLNDNEDLIADLGLGVADEDGNGGDQLSQTPIHFIINYTNATATCQMRVIGQDDEGNEAEQDRELNFNVLIQPVGS